MPEQGKARQNVVGFDFNAADKVEALRACMCHDDDQSADANTASQLTRKPTMTWSIPMVIVSLSLILFVLRLTF